VREAISHLQAAGLVETRHGIGTFVLEPAPRADGPRPGDGGDDARRAGPAGTAHQPRDRGGGLAATRRSDEQLGELRAALDSFEDCARKGVETVAPDMAFHLLIAQSSATAISTTSWPTSAPTSSRARA
jgi:GntR family transcriptional repressor for pyruvate dehydrogenase complex